MTSPSDVCTCWDAVRDTHCPQHGVNAPTPRDTFADAHALRQRAAALRAEAARLDMRAAFLTLDAHKARRRP